MNEYHEIHEIEEKMRSHTHNHRTKRKDEQIEMQEVEDDAVNHTSSEK